MNPPRIRTARRKVPPGKVAQPEVDDRVDAALIAGVANAVRQWRATTGSARGDLKLLREAVWFYWEWPRLPRPLVRRKYPTAVPWSKGAREAYHADPRRCPGLVIEHSEPVTVLLARLLTTSALDGESALAILSEQRRAFAVITKDEDKLLAKAGVGRTATRPEGPILDPLARYKLARLDTAHFLPLAEELHASSGTP
jgi:hypothetical protein